MYFPTLHGERFINCLKIYHFIQCTFYLSDFIYILIVIAIYFSLITVKCYTHLTSSEVLLIFNTVF